MTISEHIVSEISDIRTQISNMQEDLNTTCNTRGLSIDWNECKIIYPDSYEATDEMFDEILSAFEQKLQELNMRVEKLEQQYEH